MSSLNHLDTASPLTPVQTEFKSRKAKISFMLGLSSFVVSFLAGVPAIINGLLGLREIRQSGGRLQGRGLAIWGIMLGLVGSSASGSFILYTVARVREASHRLDVV
jgi:ABC-type phosphate transport system permease subunit